MKHGFFILVSETHGPMTVSPRLGADPENPTLGDTACPDLAKIAFKALYVTASGEVKILKDRPRARSGAMAEVAQALRDADEVCDGVYGRNNYTRSVSVGVARLLLERDGSL